MQYFCNPQKLIHEKYYNYINATFKNLGYTALIFSHKIECVDIRPVFIDQWK